MTTASLALVGSAPFQLLRTDPAIGGDASVLRDAIESATGPEKSIFYESWLPSPQSVVDLIRDAAESGHEVKARVVREAFTLMNALPVWAPPPELALEPDGQIGFDWVLARDRVLSLNVGRGGMVGYACRIGLESSYGSVPFAGNLPDRVKDLLRRVVEPTKASRDR